MSHCSRNIPTHMNEREEICKIIDSLPDYKISALLLFLKGMQFSDEIENNSHGTKLKRFKNGVETFRLIREVQQNFSVSGSYHSISELMDDLKDDLYYEKIRDYLDDPSIDKHETTTLEELAALEGIELSGPYHSVSELMEDLESDD